MSKGLFCNMYNVNVTGNEEERRHRCSLCLEENKGEDGNCIHLEELRTEAQAITQEVKAAIPAGAIIEKIEPYWDAEDFRNNTIKLIITYK